MIDIMTNFDYDDYEDRKLDRLLTVEEVCKLLNVKKSFVYSLTHRKKIPYIKIQKYLRFRESAINEWLKKQEVCDGGAESSEQVGDKVVRGFGVAKWKKI